MKNLIKFSCVIIVMLLWTSFLFSQPGRGLNQSEITKLYKAATETTVEGKITDVMVADSGYGRFPAVIVDLKTKDEIMKVYIGPNWYLGNEKIEMKKDQSLTATGSKVTHNDQPLIIARTMKYDGKEITFRDDKGIPVWAGKAMGPGTGRGKGRRIR
ncbi:MAG TPA: hypothetical protein ENN22_06730 [bacterium]|nr:hypothetical protein [bacterium]